MPKVSQRATKMHQLIDVRKRSRKGCQNGPRVLCFLLPFWSYFPSKGDDQFDAKIDAEQVMKIEERTMRKHIYILMILGIAFNEKSSFPKNVYVRKPNDHAVEYVSARVRRKKRKSAKEEIL